MIEVSILELEMNETIWLMEKIISFGGIGSIISIGLGFFFVKKIKDKKNPAANTFTTGLAIFGITYGVARVIENIRKYYIAGYVLSDIGEAWMNNTQITGINYDLRIIYYIIAWAGIATFYFVSEKYVFKENTKVYPNDCINRRRYSVSVLNYIPDDGAKHNHHNSFSDRIFNCSIVSNIPLFQHGTQEYGCYPKKLFYSGGRIVVFCIISNGRST